jgi:phosphotransacetylase
MKSMLEMRISRLEKLLINESNNSLSLRDALVVKFPTEARIIFSNDSDEKTVITISGLLKEGVVKYTVLWQESDIAKIENEYGKVIGSSTSNNTEKLASIIAKNFYKKYANESHSLYH